MGKVDKIKASRKADRLEDPHAWAERIENEVSMRSIVGFVALVIAVGSAASGWLLWKERDDMKHRIEQLERVSDLPPPGFTVVE